MSQRVLLSVFLLAAVLLADLQTVAACPIGSKYASRVLHPRSVHHSHIHTMQAAPTGLNVGRESARDDWQTGIELAALARALAAIVRSGNSLELILVNDYLCRRR
jgi:hypothetical protein